MTNEPTSAYKPDGNGGTLLMTYATAIHIAELMLRYGSVEVNLRATGFEGRHAFFASRQHSVYAAEDYLVSTKLVADARYTFYTFGVLYSGGKIYQFDTTREARIDEPYMSSTEQGIWNAFLDRVSYELNRLMKSKDYGGVEPDQSGRVKLRLRQREEA